VQPLKNLFRYLLASLAALIGIQSQKNREQDFKQRSALGYIISGIILVLIFILVLVGVVKFAIQVTG